MSLSAEVSWLITTLLVSVRLGVVLVATPILSTLGLPRRVRLLVVLALAATLTAGIGAGTSWAQRDPAALLLAVVGEGLLGSVLAFAVLAAFAAVQFAGRIMDIQLGFGVAGLIDPATHNRAPLLGTILNLAALLTFFLVGGHLLILRGVAFSFERIAPGTGLGAVPVAAVVEQFGTVFLFGLVLAAPVMTVVLLVDIAMAMMARTLPQLNVFIVGLPLKILVGLIVLAISVGLIAPALESLFAGLFANWQEILAR
jgi:flagellar biosynthesis protein FliR